MKQKNQIWKNMKYTWRYARQYKKEFFLFLITAFLLAAISAITPVLSAQQLLKLTDSLWEPLIIITVTILVIELCRNLIYFVCNKFSQVFFRETSIEIQMDLAEQIINLETKVLDRESSGVFSDRIIKDAFDIAAVFSDITFYLNDLLTNLGILVAVFLVNKIMFCFFIVGVGILFFFERIRMKSYYEHNKILKKISEKNTGLITELIRGMRDIKVLNASKPFITKIKTRLYETNQERYKMTGINRKYSLITGSIRDVLDFLFVILGIGLVYYQLLSVANFVVLYMYQSRIFNLLTYFSRVVEEVKKFNVSAERVYEISDDAKYAKEKFGNIHLDSVLGDIEFRHVSFAYDEAMILNDVSFKIKPNETVAFVGKSGGGKTTIFNLMSRLYSVGAGEILIDGININALDRDTIRSNISIITQNPYIFNFSIRENLMLVKEGLREEEMMEACKLASLHDYIMTLPDGYDTVVGEGGLTLSGGQRQRLAIARALVRNSQIILFDEATSALDNETQKEIQRAIHNISDDYTILIIAHRLSTIMDADRIMVLENGSIIASGSHRELLKECNTYKELYESELELES